MLARVKTATTVGLSTIPLDVEVDGNRGTPALIIIGLPSKAVDEAKERITSALQNCGVRIRAKRTVVNLAPADLPKHGSGFDLSIAIGMLKMYEEIRLNTDDAMFFGELSLTGEVKKIRGCLPLVLAAREQGIKHVFIPKENSDEVRIITGVTIHPLTHLAEYLSLAKGTARKERNFPTLTPQQFTPHFTEQHDSDFSDIFGQEQAKRALTLAAAGGHNVLLCGSPGAGKSMLAKALISLLPPLEQDETIEVTNIYSVAGLTTELMTQRPFRTPHHTTSLVGLIGGTMFPKPGEISLAHHGVLFLDELLEFPSTLLDALRQPLEEGTVTIVRSGGAVQYPARFTLVAATNPCPCGYAGSSKKTCRCSERTRQQYQQKLSGPLLDRIDIPVRVREVDCSVFAPHKNQTHAVTRGNYTDSAIRSAPRPANTRSTHVTPDKKPSNLSDSAQLRTQIIAARKRQTARYAQLPFNTNAALTSVEMRKFCHLTTAAQTYLTRASATFQLSARTYFKMIKVAQTIADLEGADLIDQNHIAESLQFRETQIW